MIKHYYLTVAELFESYFDCRKHKRNTDSALEFEMFLEDNLMMLYYELKEMVWVPGPSTVFAVTSPKPREVWAAAFRDRIVHHLIYRAIGPTFERAFIVDTCACIKERGTLYAANRLEGHLRSATQNWQKDAYILKIDISNFFGSINQSILFDRLKTKVSNEFLLYILEKLVFQDVKAGAIYTCSQRQLSLVPPHKSLLKAPEGIGLPIGNLSSQFFANVYLDPIDQAIKRELGIKHYVRYVDDMVIVHPSKHVINETLHGIKHKLDLIGMKLADSKTSIEPARHGVDFVGHVIRPFRKEWRPKSFRNAVRKIANNDSDKADKTATSYLGIAKSCGNRTQVIKLARAAIKSRNLAVNHTFTRTYPYAG